MMVVLKLFLLYFFETGPHHAAQAVLDLFHGKPPILTSLVLRLQV